MERSGPLRSHSGRSYTMLVAYTNRFYWIVYGMADAQSPPILVCFSSHTFLSVSGIHSLSQTVGVWPIGWNIYISKHAVELTQENTPKNALYTSFHFYFRASRIINILSKNGTLISVVLLYAYQKRVALKLFFILLLSEDDVFDSTLLATLPWRFTATVKYCRNPFN